MKAAGSTGRFFVGRDCAGPAADHRTESCRLSANAKIVLDS